MQDLGRSMKDMIGGSETVPSQVPEKEKNKKVYPNLCMNSEEMDGLQNLEVGDEVVFTFRARLKSFSVREDENDKSGHYDFDLLQGAFKPAMSSNNQAAEDDDLPTKASDKMESLMEDDDDE